MNTQNLPWVLIDNYDSFTHMLADYLRRLHNNLIIIRNDEVSLEYIIDLKPARIIISPGPKSPKEAGITNAVINYFYDKCPILGICLGHQALANFWNYEISHAPIPIHGKTSNLNVGTPDYWLFENISTPIQVMRYHSLCVMPNNDNQAIKFTAHSKEDDVIMVLEHHKYPCVGLQFHPESILTPDGFKMLENWDKWCINLLKS